MSNTYYEIYLADTFKLCKTLVVKDEYTAGSINKYVTTYYPNVPFDAANPRTWKYYLNLNGQYHATDVAMRIVSMDTLEEILFNKANLEIHRATAKEYQYGTRYYNDLVRRFPEQEALIFGILYPIDMTEAIEAENHTILHFDTSLVESNELNLIPKIQTWINAFFYRWHVRGYEVTDELYMASMLGLLFASMPTAVLNMRLGNCRTNYVHSYHIREYLASNGRLDVYVDYLNKRQQLFLYRNIRWLVRNAGKQETFNLLIDRILTERSIPLTSFDIRHNLEGQLENILPSVEMMGNPLNLDYLSLEGEPISVGELLDKGIGLAKGNLLDLPEAEKEAIELMQASNQNLLPTKMLESSVVDLSDSSSFTLADTLLNHWIYFGATDRYPTILTVTNPKTGEKIQVNARDAVVLYFYTLNRAHNVKMETIPEIPVMRIRKHPLPTVSEIRQYVQSEHVSDRLISAALSDNPPIGRYISTEAFYDACYEIHQRLLGHRGMYGYREDMTARGQTENMVMYLYKDVVCNIDAGESYEEWLEERGLLIDDLSILDMELLSSELLTVATGANLTTRITLKDLQDALIRLMTQLSSYSIQYLKTINNGAFVYLDWPAIRTGRDDTLLKDKEVVKAVPVEVLEVDTKLLSSLEYEAPYGARLNFGEKLFDSISINACLDVSSSSGIVVKHRIANPRIDITTITDNFPEQ